ncbi:persistent RNA/DNA binding protein [Bacillus subtilis]|nr:persistent RNA/DNA binding protein [Bacillus subtilis]
MSFDGMFTYGMTHELNEKIMGGRITKSISHISTM